MRKKIFETVFFRKRAQKTGLSPGTLVHIGEKISEKVTLHLFDYDGSRLEESRPQSLEECLERADAAGETWINVYGLHDVSIIEKIGKHFSLHPLVLEDIVNTAQRPKMEAYENYLFFALKMIYCQEEPPQKVVVEHVSLVLGPKFLVSFQEREGDVFEPTRNNLRKEKSRLRKNGVDFLAYSLLDAIIDHYFVVLEKQGDTIESMEDELVTAPGPQTLGDIHQLKRECLFMRKALWPLREMVRQLQQIETPLLTENTRLYLRDLQDHVVQVLEMQETFREMLSEMLDIYLSTVNNKMSEAMKVLTLIATMFIPLSFIVGLYGMNFRHMPELEWEWGYAMVWSIIVTTVLGMTFFFRKKKWL